jgi:pyruvate-formate lyase-activating enzyme
MRRDKIFRLEKEEKYKNKAKKIFKTRRYNIDSPDDAKKIIGQISHTRCNCSCNMCRNPRTSSFGKADKRQTLQERRFEEKTKDE